MFKLAQSLGSMFLHHEVWYIGNTQTQHVFGLFQSMTVTWSTYLFGACKYSIFRSIFQLNHVAKSLIYFNRVNASQNVSVFNHITIDSCTHELFCFNHMTVLSSMRESVWWWQFPKQRQHGHDNVNHHQSTCLSCCFNLWLSCQACVDLFDDDSFPATQTSYLMVVQSKVSICDPICQFNLDC